MAIGSEPEIGTEFGRWGDMSDDQRERWWKYMKAYWGPNLDGGYNKVIYVDQVKRDYYGTGVLSLPDLWE